MYPFYGPQTDKLHFYAEVYNSNKLYEEGKFLVNYYIETRESSTRMQNFFFNKRLAEGDSKTKEYDDNYERSIFYTRSVIETIKKQRWYPDVIHCQGWISGTAPFFIRAAYQDELPFKDTKIVYSLHGTKLKKPLPENFKDCLAFRNITAETVEKHGMPLKSFSDFAKFSLSFCDGVIQAQNGASPELLAFAQEKGIPTLPYEASDSPGQRYADFYDSLF